MLKTLDNVLVGTVLFDSFCVTFVTSLPSVGIMECCAFQTLCASGERPGISGT